MTSTLSKNLCWLRRSKGLTKKQVAAALAIKPEEYRNYESDKISPSIEILIRVSTFYGVSMEDVILQPIRF